tara:strand:+ start:503 stop:781 length:279 start_codon:yes stop_codon:yes gene_type:complete
MQLKTTKTELAEMIKEEYRKLMLENREYIQNPKNMFIEEGVSIMLVNSATGETRFGRANFRDHGIHSEADVDAIPDLIKQAVVAAIQDARSK